MEPERARRLRAEMVERQLRGRGIRDERVLAVMGDLPRERFVPSYAEPDAYADEALSIASGQTISQPYIVARMTELLRPSPGLRVLEVGTGSGYQAAVLGALGCNVLSIERFPELADAARARLVELGLDGSVEIRVGDGSLGWPDHAPYEAILVTAAAPRIPASLIEQLGDGGRLVIPVGARSHQDLIVALRDGDRIQERAAGQCVFVPLVGREGFAAEADDGVDRWL